LCIGDKIAIKDNNFYKYTTFILILLILVVIIAYVSYNVGKNSSTTTLVTTISGTSIPYTTVSSTQCSTVLTQVYVGNNLACGPFAAQLANVSPSNVSTVLIYYNGVYINQSIVGVKGNSNGPGMGYEGNVTTLNISGTTLYVFVNSPSASTQTAYIEMSTDLTEFATTVFTTVATTTTSSSTSTTSTSTTTVFTPSTTTVP
jgi:hypothetical protein